MYVRFGMVPSKEVLGIGEPYRDSARRFTYILSVTWVFRSHSLAKE